MDWTEQQDADLIRIWLGKENLKANLHLFGGRSYGAVVNHAHALKLGPRPFSDRGVKPFALDVVLAELKKSPGTIPELAERTRLTRSAVCAHVKPKWASKKGAYHVIDWRRRKHGGSYVPVFEFGPGENAPIPEAKTNSELCRDKRNRRRMNTIANGERPRFVNPFAVAAGLMPAPVGTPGRVYQQSMSIKDEELEEA
ncbi:hypothetical protein [Burkholderia pseudomallei]|uniref:hypothetical protein n=1 Tax=Burkholderia pseudomallei TaxID=28450 RepID=UPI0012F510FA|nr:hypothetical protein [Burkholderia pseudomallei]